MEKNYNNGKIQMKEKKSELVYSTDPEMQGLIKKNKGTNSHDEINLPVDKQTVRVFIQTKGRRGKKVTIISGFKHNTETMLTLAKELKQLCSAGGTVKGNEIEIQGDSRDLITKKLQEKGYKVKSG